MIISEDQQPIWGYEVRRTSRERNRLRNVHLRWTCSVFGVFGLWLSHSSGDAEAIFWFVVAFTVLGALMGLSTSALNDSYFDWVDTDEYGNPLPTRPHSPWRLY